MNPQLVWLYPVPDMLMVAPAGCHQAGIRMAAWGLVTCCSCPTPFLHTGGRAAVCCAQRSCVHSLSHAGRAGLCLTACHLLQQATLSQGCSCVWGQGCGRVQVVSLAWAPLAAAGLGALCWFLLLLVPRFPSGMRISSGPCYALMTGCPAAAAAAAAAVDWGWAKQCAHVCRHGCRPASVGAARQLAAAHGLPCGCVRLGHCWCWGMLAGAASRSLHMCLRVPLCASSGATSTEHASTHCTPGPSSHVRTLQGKHVTVHAGVHAQLVVQVPLRQAWDHRTRGRGTLRLVPPAPTTCMRHGEAKYPAYLCPLCLGASCAVHLSVPPSFDCALTTYEPLTSRNAAGALVPAPAACAA